jgi:hypothetical protein
MWNFLFALISALDKIALASVDSGRGEVINSDMLSLLSKTLSHSFSIDFRERVLPFF